MNHPNVHLMRAYGTFDVFKEKTADVQPIASRIAQIAMGRAMLAQRIRSMTGDTARQTAAAERMNTHFRMLELAQMERAIDNANFTRAPAFLPKGWDDMPIGMTEGMIRLASVAGETMAKTADPYRTAAPVPPPVAAAPKTGVLPKTRAAKTKQVPDLVDKTKDLADHAGDMWQRSGLSKGRWKYKLPMLAGAGLAAYGTMRAAQGVSNWMSQESPPRTYYSGGNRLAPDINEYGAPQYSMPYY